VSGDALAAGAVVLLSFADGGYRRESWHVATVALVAATGLAVVLDGRPTLGRLQLLALGGTAALTAWTALSAAWSVDQHASQLEAERTLVYLALLVAAFTIRGSLLRGTIVGITLVCAYAVGERLLRGAPDPPDPFECTLLAEPLGYANALGGLAAIALAAVIGLLALRRRRPMLLAVALLLVTTLVMTGSRGGWLAALAGGGIAVAIALGRPRGAAALAAAAAILVVAALALSAGSFTDDLARHAGDRPWYWHVAWNEARDEPLAGRGAGTFVLGWIEQRPIDVDVRDAHSLYLETLAELGIVGLALLILVLAAPLAGFGPSAGAAAAGGYVAFLVHAGLDWDWEMPAVTVAGLLCGASLLVGEERKFSARSAST
jgi:O-antigen ligase